LVSLGPVSPPQLQCGKARGAPGVDDPQPGRTEGGSRGVRGWERGFREVREVLGFRLGIGDQASF